jgi:hypothetical protein
MEMLDDAQQLLLLLVDLDQEQTSKGFPISYLAGRLYLNRERTLHLLEEFEAEGWIRFSDHGHTRLAYPTFGGYQQAAAWRAVPTEDNWFERIPKPLKVVGGSLLAALLALFLWWIGLSPETSPLQPFWARVPLRVYVGREVRVGPGYWFHFPNAPEPTERLSFASENQHVLFMDELFDGGAQVSFSGRYTLHFDLENIDSRYQANITALKVELISSAIEDPEDTLFLPEGLGGGTMWKYEVETTPQKEVSEQEGVEIYGARLRAGDEDVDYVFLRPGERESFEVVVTLPGPGLYKLTPLIEYSFRDKVAVLRAESYDILYPHRYRIWHGSGWWSDDIDTNTISTANVILDTQSWGVQLPGQRMTPTGCSTGGRWIAFLSDLLSVSHTEQLYLVNPESTDLFIVAPTEHHLFGLGQLEYAWTQQGQLLFGGGGRTDYLVEPGTRRFQPTAESLFTELDLADHVQLPVCFSDGRGCLRLREFEDSNQDGRVDTADNSQICLDREGAITRLGFATYAHQHDIALSPDETQIAYVQGSRWSCSLDTPQDLYKMDADGQNVQLLSQQPGCYRNPSWSPDGRFLAFAVAWAAPDDDGSAIYHIHVLDLRNGLTRQLTSGSLSDGWPRWSADGEWVLGGGARLTLTRADGSCSQEVFVPPAGTIRDAALQP